MKEEVVSELEQQLEALTGDEVGQPGQPCGGAQHLYRALCLSVSRQDDRLSGAGLPSISHPEDVFSREPLLATFVEKDTGRAFSAANVHIAYGDSKADRSAEIRHAGRYL